MPTMITEDLQHTVIGDWHTRLSANRSPRRNHWQTKITYFEAVAGLLAGRPGTPLTWKSVVGATRPYGCRSTFYEVAGAHARHRMIDDLIAHGTPDAYQLALRYLRTDPVEQLIDETKVWSFWPYRVRLLDRLARPGRTLEDQEQDLIDTVRTWARSHDSLAAAVGHSPPACAVEDLTVLHQGRLAALRAASRLSDVLRG